MADRKAVVKNADMSEDMQQDAIDIATQALEKFNIEKDIAAFIKKEFDKKYNPTWHCIVGRNFGSYITHETKHFIYFYLGQVASRATKIMKKAPPKVDKVFDCPYCSHSATVEVKMMRPKKIAYLSCRICTTSYQHTISHLNKEVDVYCAWIDEAEAKNKKHRGGISQGLGFSAPKTGENAEESSEEEEIVPQYTEPATQFTPKNYQLLKGQVGKNLPRGQLRQAGQVPLRTLNGQQDSDSSDDISEEEKSEDDEDDRRITKKPVPQRQTATAGDDEDSEDEDLF
ncbi:UNKNOWN [Stylonychia lemnae]|uniref:Dynein light chain n=1 Tax=Stylonychia lemnae TaxID=5949 RepID=A0A077ZTB1_STYLE|nr:UNKNOWN [Stylonychia lemnae]|eukprot:CDW72784.1 UNKNOWN [Stylonychia lemnae]